MRWCLILSRYNFRIVHVSGKHNKRADAFSRRDQDMPDNQDERLVDRNVCLLKPEVLEMRNIVQSLPIAINKEQSSNSNMVGKLPDEFIKLNLAIQEDSQ